MKPQQNVDLSSYNTFGIKVQANFFIELTHKNDLPEIVQWTNDNKTQFLVIGEGSNILFTQDFDGLIIVNHLLGKSIIKHDEHYIWVRLAAGENWHNAVKWSLEQQSYGLENLALIPGTVGAAPIQNIGAYGVELSNFLEKVEIYDIDHNQLITLQNNECQFGYRNSIFKQNPGKYIITAIILKLRKQPKLKTSYQGITTKLNKLSLTSTPENIFKVICDLRQEKLPNPKQLGNAGSFFKNPIINQEKLLILQKKLPNIPHYPQLNDKYKISAAYLIEHAGLKGFKDSQVGISEKHALVIINHGNASGEQIANFAKFIQETVLNKLDIWLEPEPIII